MRCLERKARQHNTTERQSNTTQLAQGSIFQRKKLPRVGLEPTTVRLLGNALTNFATEATQLAGLKSHIQYKTTKAPQPKHHKPDELVNSNLTCTHRNISNCSHFTFVNISNTWDPHTFSVCSKIISLYGNTSRR